MWIRPTRFWKKKLQREGVFREMKLRNHYEKPSEKRAREKAESVRRVRKLARKAHSVRVWFWASANTKLGKITGQFGNEKAPEGAFFMSLLPVCDSTRKP